MLNLLVVLLVQKYCTKTLHALYNNVYYMLHSWSMHAFDFQIAIHVLCAPSATGTRCSVMSCIQIYIYAIRIERALSLQIIISFHRNGTFNLLFAHMFRCVLRPLLEVLTTVFLSTVIFERTLQNLSINCSLSIYFSGPICAKFDDSVDRSLLPSRAFDIKWRRQQHGPMHKPHSVGGASKWHFCPPF